MRVAPRHQNQPSEEALERLRKAATAADNAKSELKAAVINASDAGGSVRVIATTGNISTRTVQDWLKDR